MSFVVLSRFASHRHALIPSQFLLFRFSSTPGSSESIVDNLVSTFGFSRSKALLISSRVPRLRNPENPQNLLKVFLSLGFSETQIRASVALAPVLLSCDANKILKPKLEYFQEVGLVGSELGSFISRNPKVLTCSLHRRLIPCTEIIRRVLSEGNCGPEDLKKVLRRCNWILYKKPESGLLSTIAYLKSCGIVGSQLSQLLKKQPSIFVMKEFRLRQFVAEAVAMGIPVNSRMLVYAVYVISCLSKQTIRRKLNLLKSYGFSDYECMEMIRKAPSLLLTSEDKIKLGIEFFTNTIKIKRSVLVYRPSCLMNSIEERTFPRYRVLQVLKSKRLLKKDPSFLQVLNMTEDNFLNKFISRFRDCAEELLVAYKGHLIDSSDS